MEFRAKPDYRKRNNLSKTARRSSALVLCSVAQLLQRIFTKRNCSMNLQKMITRSRLCLLGLLGLTLIAAPVAAQVNGPGPSDPALFDNVINVPSDPVPTIIDGTQVNVSSGGSVGSFSAFSSEVNISGGSVGSFDAFDSELNISGGSIAGIDVIESELNISGGTIAGIDVNDGELNISGGTIDGAVSALFFADVNISGGDITGDFRADFGGVVDISGGTFGGDFIFFEDVWANISGSDFFLSGVPVQSLTVASPVSTINDRSSILTGVLADGSPFSFDLSLSDVFSGGSNNSLTLTLVESVPEPGSLVLLGLGGLVFLGRRRTR